MGGAVLITRDLFLRVNGYPNAFYGWGHEDDVFSVRLMRSGCVPFPGWGVPLGSFLG